MPLPIPQMFTSNTFCEPPKKLIVLAWMIEVVAVSVSASLAAYPLVTGGDGTIDKWLMAAPFLVIAFAELAKIPAVEAMLRLKGMVLPCVAGFAAVLICLNTFYMVSNGFERAHVAKTRDIAAVQREIADLERQLVPSDSDIARLRAERDSLNELLADINRREEKDFERYAELVKELLKAGKAVPSGMRAQIYQKYEAERKPVVARIDLINARLNGLETSKLDSAMQEAKTRLNNMIHDNQIYRFAAMVYGYDDPTKMTAKELNTFCFVWFGLIAFAVSTLGPLLALCYYRIKFQTAVGRTAWSRLLQAVRRLVLRLARRNKIVKTEEVERIIEKQVEVPVEVVREVVKEVKVKELIYVPMIFTNDRDVLKGQLA